MARISKLVNKHRLRYKVYFPDGEIVERSRLVDSVRVAREKMVLANEIEVHTAGQTYSSRDVIIWHNARLISRADRARLEGDLPGHGKTLSDCLDEWEATWTVCPEEIESRSARRKNIETILGKDTPIKSLEFTDGLVMVNELKARGRKVTYIRKHVRDLKSAFNHQLAIRYLPYNAFATLSAGRTPPEEKIKHAILTDDQIREVLDRADKKDRQDRPWLQGTLTLHLLMFFGLGIRRKEVLLARWAMIDWKERSITLPAEITKTKKKRTIGLGTRLYNELKAQSSKLKAETSKDVPKSEIQNPKSEFILPRLHPETVSKAIRTLFRECGIVARLHDARHTYTTMLQDVGVPPHRAMGRTGHADMRMLSHYSHGDFDEVYEDRFGFMKDK